MQIFISWSGDLSKAIAKELYEFIPLILQHTKPYYTPNDIDKGARWLNEILKNLNDCQCGIVCITADNYDKPWVLFEAGAIANKFENSLVCPIFFNISKTDVRNPLTQVFQSTDFNKADFKQLISTINKNLGEYQIGERQLEKLFDSFYPEFEEKIANLISKHSSRNANEESKPKRNTEDMVAEILELTRQLSRNQVTGKVISTEKVKTRLIPDSHLKSRQNAQVVMLKNNDSEWFAIDHYTGELLMIAETDENLIKGMISKSKDDGYESITMFHENGRLIEKKF